MKMTEIRKKIAVILAIILIIAFVFNFFQSKFSGNRNAKNELFEQYLSSAKSIETAELQYRSVLTISFGENTTTVEIMGKSYQKGNNRFDESLVKVGGKNVNMRTYMFGDKVHVCNNIDGKWKCGEVKMLVPLSHRDSLEFVENMYKKGAMTFYTPSGTTGGGQKVINGRACNLLNINVDPSKLSKEEKYFALAVAGLSSIKEPDRYIDKISSFSISLCVVGGIDLESEYILNISAMHINAHSRTTIDSYEINKEIPDSLFILPSDQS
jgi:outer membrane lipoprotein-sorting protein